MPSGADALAKTVVYFTTLTTAMGPFGIAWTAAGVFATALPAQTQASVERHLFRVVAERFPDAGPPVRSEPDEPWLQHLVAAIHEHFAGKPRPYTDVPLDVRNLSDFRVRVYEAARQIPPSATVSYGELARLAGSPGSARAIGRAMATNPFPLIVPCQRVVAANGDLHGFSSPGGTRTKARLLELERKEALAPPERQISLFPLPPRSAG